MTMMTMMNMMTMNTMRTMMNMMIRMMIIEQSWPISNHADTIRSAASSLCLLIIPNSASCSTVLYFKAVHFALEAHNLKITFSSYNSSVKLLPDWIKFFQHCKSHLVSTSFHFGPNPQFLYFRGSLTINYDIT